MAETAETVVNGLSGHTVRASVDASLSQPDSALRGLDETVRHAASFIRNAAEMTGEALGKAVDAASDAAFQEAAAVSSQPIGQPAFSWSGYVQALGIMCVLLAALWFAVWALRKYGKFNFIPRPGALSRSALVMEAQMPLGPRKGLMVVNFMGRRLLLGVTEHQISYITEEKARDDAPQTNKFQKYMDSASAGDSDSADS